MQEKSNIENQRGNFFKLGYIHDQNVKYFEGLLGFEWEFVSDQQPWQQSRFTAILAIHGFIIHVSLLVSNEHLVKPLNPSILQTWVLCVFDSKSDQVFV